MAFIFVGPTGFTTNKNYLILVFRIMLTRMSLMNKPIFGYINKKVRFQTKIVWFRTKIV